MSYYYINMEVRKSIKTFHSYQYSFPEKNILRFDKPFLIKKIFNPNSIICFEELYQELENTYIIVREFAELHGIPKWRWKHFGKQIPMKFSNYRQSIHSGEASLKDRYLSTPISGLRSICKVEEILDNFGKRYQRDNLYKDVSCRLWMGPSGHNSPLHTDEGDGTLLHFSGIKKVILFPPQMTKNVYPFSFLSPINPYVSMVDIDHPNLMKFPRFSQAKSYACEAILEPGDLLYIPTQWWHEVIGVSGKTVLSMNRMWNPGFRILKNFYSIIWYLKRKIPIETVVKMQNLVQKRARRRIDK